MKVGILTYHAVCNFGANLQTLSTVSFFKNMGIDVFVINWYPRDLENYYENHISYEQIVEHDKFVKQYLPITERCFTSEEVSDIITSLQLDAVIIGSDAVFSYIPIRKRIHPSRKTIIGITKVSSDHSYPNPFWADFKNQTKDIKVFAMSASAQYLDVDRCFCFERKKLKHALKKFDGISVRDRWTRYVLSLLTNCSYDITPDPVFAFNTNVSNTCTREAITVKYNLPDKYIIISFCNNIVSENWITQINKLSHEYGFKTVNLAMPEGCLPIKCDYIIDIPISPIDWYNIIKYSSGYIGQRMHPLIVAFHNLVPFYIFDHYAYKKGHRQLESSKIYDLLERADFLNNYYNIKDKSVPLPSKVIDSLLNIDKDKMQRFVKGYNTLYYEMMNEIIKSI